IALDADCVLAFPTETPAFFPSSSAAVALIEILTEQLRAKAGKQAGNDIARTEGQLHQAGECLNTIYDHSCCHCLNCRAHRFKLGKPWASSARKPPIPT